MDIIITSNTACHKVNKDILVNNSEFFKLNFEWNPKVTEIEIPDQVSGKALYYILESFKGNSIPHNWLVTNYLAYRNAYEFLGISSDPIIPEFKFCYAKGTTSSTRQGVYWPEFCEQTDFADKLNNYFGFPNGYIQRVHIGKPYQYGKYKATITFESEPKLVITLEPHNINWNLVYGDLSQLYEIAYKYHSKL